MYIFGLCNMGLKLCSRQQSLLARRARSVYFCYVLARAVHRVDVRGMVCRCGFLTLFVYDFLYLDVR